MDETIRLIRVFLASPGDLQEERRLVYEAVEELNKSIAYHFGFRVELKGWEDTLTASGRPQELINQELDRCELFIGVMWKKWGTPPSKEGNYSSGFEEEFERSTSRQKDTGLPEMAMYFKDIDTLTIDPKDDFNKIKEDLDKVMAFKKRLISEKEIYFEGFTDPRDFQRQVRLNISNYLIKLTKVEEKKLDEKQAKSKNEIDTVDTSQNTELKKSLISIEGHSFLKKFLKKVEFLEDTEEVSSFEIARFRLLSNAISKPGNHEPFLGVHDANILYENKNTDYSKREISRLIDCGLKNISHENTPLWFWYDKINAKSHMGFLQFRSLSKNDDDVSVGALEAMKLIGSILPYKEEVINREYFIGEWLSDSSSEKIKIAALRYLKYHGKDIDLPFIVSEVDNANSQTSRISIEAMLSIQLRYKKAEALESVFLNQFESFDEKLLDTVLQVSLDINSKFLKSGLNHRNKKVRLESLKRLIEKEEITSDELQELKKDEYVQIRKQVVDYLILNNHPLDNKQVKNILVRPKISTGLAGLIAPPFSGDIEGRVCYDKYMFLQYYKMPESTLLDILKADSFYNHTPYFALCSHYFKKYSAALRVEVDNQFEGIYKNHIKRLVGLGATEEIINKSRDLEEFMRKKLTRKGLDLLCKKGNILDLQRIRKNMRSDYVKSSFDEIQYISKFGDWEDISFIIKSEKENSSQNSLLMSAFDNDWHKCIAKSLYKISGERFEEVLNFDMQQSIKIEIIKLCSPSVFSEIQEVALFELLNDENENIRKFASLNCIRSFNKTKLKNTLSKYVENKGYRYYNVIFWLDFGVYMSKPITNKAIKNYIE